MNKEVENRFNWQEKRIEKMEATVAELKENLYRIRGGDELITRGQRTATLIILLLTCVVGVFQLIKMAGQSSSLAL